MTDDYRAGLEAEEQVRFDAFMTAAKGLNAAETAKVMQRHAVGVDFRDSAKGGMARAYATSLRAYTSTSFRWKGEKLIDDLAAAPRKPKAAPAKLGPPGPPQVVPEWGRTYRLAVSVRNPKPDRRSSEWRHRELIPAGTELYGGTHGELWRVYEHHDVRPSQELYGHLVANLVVVTGLDAELRYFQALYHLNGRDILQHLWDVGELTHDKLEAIALAHVGTPPVTTED